MKAFVLVALTTALVVTVANGADTNSTTVAATTTGTLATFPTVTLPPQRLILTHQPQFIRSVAEYPVQIVSNGQRLPEPSQTPRPTTGSGGIAPLILQQQPNHQILQSFVQIPPQIFSPAGLNFIQPQQQQFIYAQQVPDFVVPFLRQPTFSFNPTQETLRVVSNNNNNNNQAPILSPISFAPTSFQPLPQHQEQFKFQYASGGSNAFPILRVPVARRLPIPSPIFIGGLGDIQIQQHAPVTVPASQPAPAKQTLISQPISVPTLKPISGPPTRLISAPIPVPIPAPTRAPAQAQTPISIRLPPPSAPAQIPVRIPPPAPAPVQVPTPPAPLPTPPPVPETPLPDVSGPKILPPDMPTKPETSEPERPQTAPIPVRIASPLPSARPQQEQIPFIPPFLPRPQPLPPLPLQSQVIYSPSLPSTLPSGRPIAVGAVASSSSNKAVKG